MRFKNVTPNDEFFCFLVAVNFHDKNFMKKVQNGYTTGCLKKHGNSVTNWISSLL